MSFMFIFSFDEHTLGVVGVDKVALVIILAVIGFVLDAF